MLQVLKALIYDIFVNSVKSSNSPVYSAPPCISDCRVLIAGENRPAAGAGSIEV